MREGLLVEGVALVVAGDRGSQLLFRYPVQPYSPLDTVIPVRITDKASANQINVPLFGIRPSEFANLFCPKSALFGNVLSFLVGNHHFMSYPLQLPAAKTQEITFFNVVLILSKSSTNYRMFESVIERLAKILLHEQNRCQFMTQEVQKILSMQDQFMAAATNKGAWTLVEQHAALKDLTDKIVSKSLLANHLKKMVDQLHEKDACRLLINDWCSLCVSLSDPEFQPAQKQIRPYQTLLLTQRSMTILESLPKDCSPQLRYLVQRANPCHSFAELERLLEISLNQLYRLSAHLVYWGKARIVNRVCDNYVYVVPPTLHEVSPSSASASEFGTRFPTQSLPEVLSRFCVHKKLSEHFKRLSTKAKEQELHMLLWLLQRRFVEQLHTYLYLAPHLHDEVTVHVGSPSLMPRTVRQRSAGAMSPSSSPSFRPQPSSPLIKSTSPAISPRKTPIVTEPTTTVARLAPLHTSCDTSTSPLIITTPPTPAESLPISTTSLPPSASLTPIGVPATSPRIKPQATVIHANAPSSSLALSSFTAPSPTPTPFVIPSPALSFPASSPAFSLRSSPVSLASAASSVTISVSPASPSSCTPKLSSPAYSSVPLSASPSSLHRQNSSIVPPALNPTELLFLRLKPYFNGEFDTTEICWREDVSALALDALCAAKPDEIITVTTFAPAE